MYTSRAHSFHVYLNEGEIPYAVYTDKHQTRNCDTASDESLPWTYSRYVDNACASFERRNKFFIIREQVTLRLSITFSYGCK